MRIDKPIRAAVLFLMLGAKRGIAVDLDSIQDRERALKALADCAAMMLVDPRGLVGDYPIERAKVLEKHRFIRSGTLARRRLHRPRRLQVAISTGISQAAFARKRRSGPGALEVLPGARGKCQ
jgi:hypothetical protein